ncbi:hypothetical protein BRADI_1g00213v3 [Brachypodium distachyon]|uniref:DUF4283 domain-containing protein n=1 Tax=Brachypodium distachyon TaxID=15368 RepID=A0A0Q3N576_BRADI|nr:hypothetical protein BRADI_1g00213v3 [Brachypodium distachyon]
MAIADAESNYTSAPAWAQPSTETTLLSSSLRYASTMELGHDLPWDDAYCISPPFKLLLCIPTCLRPNSIPSAPQTPHRPVTRKMLSLFACRIPSPADVSPPVPIRHARRLQDSPHAADLSPVPVRSTSPSFAQVCTASGPSSALVPGGSRASPRLPDFAIGSAPVASPPMLTAGPADGTCAADGSWGTTRSDRSWQLARTPVRQGFFRPDGAFVDLAGRCFRCLSSSHQVAFCTFPVKCTHCFESGHIAKLPPAASILHSPSSSPPPRPATPAVRSRLTFPTQPTAPPVRSRLTIPLSPPAPPPPPSTATPPPSLPPALLRCWMLLGLTPCCPSLPLSWTAALSTALTMAGRWVCATRCSTPPSVSMKLVGMRPRLAPPDIYEALMEAMPNMPCDACRVDLLYPDAFLLVFNHFRWKEELRSLGVIHHQGTPLTIRPWSRHHFATQVTYRHYVCLFIEGLPAHSFNVATARRILPNAFITGVAEICTNSADFSYFVVKGWVEDTNSIPKEFNLDIPEPPRRGIDSALLPDGFTEIIDDGPDSTLPPPPPVLSHPLIIHLDSISVLHAGADGTATDGSDRDSYRFNWACGCVDGTVDVSSEPFVASMARLGCVGEADLRCASGGSRHGRRRAIASDPSLAPSEATAAASLSIALVPPAVRAAAACAASAVAAVAGAAPPVAVPAVSAMAVPTVPTVAVPAVADHGALPLGTPVAPAVPHASSDLEMPLPAAPLVAPTLLAPAAVAADPAPPADAAAAQPNLTDFLQRVAEAITPGLL